MFSKKRADTANETASEPPRTPLVVETTGNWRGNDGSWSTFYINVGDKENNGGGQNFEILPSTHFGVTVLPFQADWCTGDCSKLRGVGEVNGEQAEGLNTDDSSTWNEVGTYDLATPYWWYGNASDPPAGYYGLDYLGIGRASSKSWVMPKMYVAATKSEDFYIGQFGLAPGAFNPGGGSGTPVNSIIHSLNSTGTIPSVSYGYTAGAKYRNNGNGITGSLVLGGYDSARINPDNLVTIDMPSDKNTSLVVGVQGITYKPDVNVEQNVKGLTDNVVKSFMATIDSTFPYLWLPDHICDNFASSFNLEYDNKTNFYTINATGAQNNDQQNAVVTFKIGSDPSGSGAEHTSISLPYSAFELTMFNPESSDNTTKYFPIRKSTNGMFVLGRTLLQEAYIVADYSRHNFTVAEVPSLKSVPDAKIVTIHDPSYVAPSPTPISTSGGGGLSGGAIAGIVIGILAVALGAALGMFIWWKKRRERNNAPPAYKETVEIDTSAAGDQIKHRRVSELDSRPPGAPKTTALGGFYGDDRDNKDTSPFPPISELDSPPAELYSPPVAAATPHSEASGSADYFTVGNKLGRRGATREISAQNTPGTPPPFTPIAELPGDDGGYAVGGQHFDPVITPKGSPTLSSGSLAKRDPSASRSQNNIDEVMKRRSAEPSPARPAGVAEGADKEGVPEGERRPSHTRGASDATVQSDITAVSQPSPEELERWALAGDEQPRRPLSE